MNKNKNSKIMLVLSIFIILLIMGAATAADNDKTSIQNETLNTLTSTDEDVNVIEASNNDVTVDEKVSTADNTDNTIVGSSDTDSNSNKLESTNKQNTILGSTNEDLLSAEEGFSSLNNIIKLSDNYYKLNDDYSYDSQSIIISKNNFILDGNGKTLNGNNNQVFSITGNNVTLKNLTIKGSLENMWTGANGKLLNCILKDSSDSTSNDNRIIAFIHWDGNNAHIENCTFTNINFTTSDMNPTSGNFLYFSGINVYLKNNTFKDSYGRLRFQVVIDASAVGLNKIENCTFQNLTTNNKQGSSTVFIRGSESEIINCHFKNNYLLNAYNDDSSEVLSTGYTKVYNSTFLITNEMDFILQGVNYAYGCNFTGTTNINSVNAYGYYCDYENCNFNNTSSASVSYVNSFTNCNFTNIQLNKPLFELSKSATDDWHYNLYNCRFIDNTFDTDYIIDVNKGGKYIFENLVFEGNSAKSALININTGISINVINPTYGNNNVPTDIINGGQNFTPNHILYVSDTPNGEGYSNKSCTNLSDAMSKIDVGGTIIIMNGTHNIEQESIAVNYNIIGKKNVIINTLTTTQFNLGTGYNITGITFKNLYRINMGSYVTLSNITIAESNINQIFYFHGKTHVTMNNIKLVNSTVSQNVFTFTNSRSMNIAPAFTLNGLTLKNTTSQNSHIFTVHAFFESSVSNVIVDNSTINCVWWKSGQTFTSTNSKFDTIKVFNSTMRNSLFHVNSNGDDVKYTNIYIENTTRFNRYPSNAILYLGKNQVMNTVILKNLTLDDGIQYIFNLAGSGIVIDNVQISDLDDNQSILFYNTAGGNTLNHITVDNVNMKTVSSSNTNMNYNDITIIKSNFTDAPLFLGGHNSLEDSHIEDVNCSIIVSDNVNIIGTTFNNVRSINGSLYVIGENCFIDTCTFSDNHATNTGGAITVMYTGCQILDTTFTNNSADVHGGALFIKSNISYYMDDLSTPLPEEYDQTSPVLNGVYRVGFTPTYDKIFVYHGAPNAGGHFDNLAMAFALINPSGEIIAYKSGETFDFTRSPYAFGRSSVTVIGNNTTVNVLAPIEIGERGVNFTLKNLIFTGATNHTIIWKGADGKIINCTFKDSIMSQDKYSTIPDEAFGLALDIEAENMLIRNCTFENNTIEVSDALGGIVYVNSTGLKMENCTFNNNIANVANCIYLTDNSGISTISQVTIANNKYFNGRGYGSIVFYGKELHIEDSMFKNNTGYSASVLYLNSPIAIVNLTNNTFINNHANDGGVVYVESCDELVFDEDTRLLDNDAIRGGVLFISKLYNLELYSIVSGNNATYGGVIYTNAALNVNSLNLTSNNATYGGAIYTNALLSVSDSNFTGNNAIRGGAIYANAPLTVDGVNFIRNTASYGGALYLNASGNSLNNVLFEGNVASYGGALYLADGLSVSLNTVECIDNSYTDLSKYWGTIYLGDNVIFGAKNLNLHDQQDIYNGTYFASVLYVTGSSVSPGALGLTDDDPISFGDALTHVKNGVDTRIIFAKGNYEFDKTYSIANKNITLVGNNSYIKRNNNNKSLFNNSLTHIKSCS